MKVPSKDIESLTKLPDTYHVPNILLRTWLQLSLSMRIISIGGKYYYGTHFTDEKTEAQRLSNSSVSYDQEAII